MKKITLFLLLIGVSCLYAQNQMQITQLSMIDGYSQIPVGQNLPVKIKAKFINSGVFTQNNIKLHVKELTSQTDYVTIIPLSLSAGNNDSLNIDSIYLPAFAGNYHLISWLSSDSLNQVLYPDTFNITINNNNLFSRDNNNYTGSKWNGATIDSICNSFVPTNKYQVKQAALATGISFVVGSLTKPGSKVRVRLFKYFAAYGLKIIVAQSNEYFLTATDIPVSTGFNPPSVTLNFTSPYALSPDTVYYAAVQIYGGLDTVHIAMDNTSSPQNPQNAPYFDPQLNQWQNWSTDEIPSPMIRLQISTLSSLNPYFYVTPQTQFINSNANSSASFTVLSNLTTWNATTMTPWLTLTSNFVNGTITATSNSSNTTGSNRTGTITVNAVGFLSQTDTVIQYSDPPYIGINPLFVTLPKDSGSFQDCYVHSNINWTASTNASWLDVTYDVVLNRITITTTSINNGGYSRTDSVEVIGSGGVTNYITVTQLSVNPIFSVTPAIQSIAYYANEYASFNVLSNVTNWSASTNVSWLYFDYDASNGYISVISNEENLSLSPRTAIILINIPGLPQQTISVIQQGYLSNFNVSPAVVTLTYTAGSSGIFNVSTSLNGWYANTTDSWLNTIVNVTNQTITVTSNTANTSSSTIYGSINIIYNNYIIQTLTVIQTPPGLSIEEITASDILLFPNPCRNILNINFGGNKENTAKLKVYSITGNEVINIDAIQVNKKTLQLDVATLSKGMYFIQLKDKLHTITRKFIKD